MEKIFTASVICLWPTKKMGWLTDIEYNYDA